MRHHLIPVRRLLQTANVSEGLEKREPLDNCWWECKPVQSLRKTVCVCVHACSVLSDLRRAGHPTDHDRRPHPFQGLSLRAQLVPEASWAFLAAARQTTHLRYVVDMVSSGESVVPATPSWVVDSRGSTMRQQSERVC